MSSAPANVRADIFNRWNPNLGVLAEDERNNAEQLWQELKSVSEAGAWRSTALLTGQLVEAHLRSKVVAAGSSRLEVKSLWTLSLVVRSAIEKGLLQRSEPTRTLLKATIKLRNESSHFAFWRPYTSEREATWTLALAVLVLDDLGLGRTTDADSYFRGWLQAEAQSLEPLASMTGTAVSAPTSAKTVSKKAKGSSDSLGGVRSAITARWSPPARDFSIVERAGIAALWLELKLAIERKAWRAVASLSGQMIEAYLKCKLVNEGKETQGVAGRMVLDRLIDRAAEEALFARSPGRTTTGADAVHSAEILRNWASHYAFWLPYTNELRATQALALSVAILESLYPEETPKFVSPGASVTPAWVTANWKSAAPGTLLRFLESTPINPAPFDRPTLEVFEYMVRFGGLRTMQELSGWIKRSSLPREEFRAAVHSCFPDLLRKAHRESLKLLMNSVFVLDGLFRSHDPDEPTAHAQVFGAMLPIDSASLKAVFKLPTMRIPLYFALATKSAGNLLAQGLRCDERPCSGPGCNSTRCRDLIPAFWEEFDPSKNENPLNMANTIGRMPNDVKVDFLTRIPDSFLKDRTRRPFYEWLENNSARNAVNLLAYLGKDVLELDKTGRLGSLKEGIVAAIIAAVGKDPLEKLAELPKRVYELRITVDDDAKSVMQAVLARTKTKDTTGNNTRRILWDLYQYVPSLALESVKLGEYVLDRGLVPFWDAVCLAGMLEVNSIGTCMRRWSELTWDQAEFESKLANVTNIDRWQKLLALLAVFRRAVALRSRVPRNIGSAAQEILRTIRTEASPQPSIALVAQVRAELAIAG